MTFWLLCMSKAQGFDMPSSCCRMSPREAGHRFPLWFWCKEEPGLLRGLQGALREKGSGSVVFAPPALHPNKSPHIISVLGDAAPWVGISLVLGRQGGLGLSLETCSPACGCLITHCNSRSCLKKGGRVQKCRSKIHSESHSLCLGLICISHSSFAQCQLCTVPVVLSLGCKRPDCLRKTEAEQLLLWCQILQPTSLSFVLFCYCVFAASLNAELLEGIMQLS